MPPDVHPVAFVSDRPRDAANFFTRFKNGGNNAERLRNSSPAVNPAGPAPMMIAFFAIRLLA